MHTHRCIYCHTDVLHVVLISHQASSVATLYIDIDAAEFEDSQIQDIGALFINMGCLVLSLQWEPEGINSIG